MSTGSLAVGASVASNSSPDQEYHVSLAHALPMEMVEAILLHLTAPELILAAAHLPKWWRDVISASLVLWQKLARHEYDHQINILLSYVGQPYCSASPRPVATSILLLLRGGLLFGHSGPRGRGYIFAPGSDRELLKIVDTSTMSPWYRNPGRKDQWSIKLYDLDGGLVCDEHVTDETKVYVSRLMDPVTEANEDAER